MPSQYNLLYNTSLADYTSWHVGGKAKCLFFPKDYEDIKAFLLQLPIDEPLLWLGLGTNVLIRDGGFPGTVIITKKIAAILEQIDISSIKVGAGINCAKLARFAATAGLTGTEFLAGIPGTIGGALALNAGAFGAEIWSLVDTVKTIDKKAIIRQRPPSDYQIGYREAKGPAHEWFLEANLLLATGSTATAKMRIKDCLDKRFATQPIGKHSAGSTFRNPPGDHAGRLIEASSLKGLSCGGAKVSEKHANFIINTGNATACDIENLIIQIQHAVKQNFAVDLIPEVHIVGEK